MKFQALPSVLDWENEVIMFNTLKVALSRRSKCLCLFALLGHGVILHFVILVNSSQINMKGEKKRLRTKSRFGVDAFGEMMYRVCQLQVWGTFAKHL